MALPLLVLDASASLALLFADEAETQVAKVLAEVVENNGQIFVPPLFWYELGNALLSARRSNRITESDSRSANALLSRLPIVTDARADVEAQERMMALAWVHGLSFYDAAYLELALRLQCRLKSLDKHLLALRSHYPFVL